MTRTRVVIQSRLNSSRLPGKALMTIGGMPLIELVARRASRTDYEVIVATSVEADDDRIASHLERVGIPVMRGDLDDVLGRFVAATSDLNDDDRVVRLTGDNPIMDADVIAELMAAMEHDDHAYGRVDIDVVPEGLGCEVFTAGDLRRAAASTDDPYDREHVTPWLRRTLGELLFAPQANPGNVEGYRATVDCLNDYYRISRLFDDEPDPVGVSWTTLMGRLIQTVDAAGARAHRIDREGPRLTHVLLGTSRLGLGKDGSRDAAVVRETCTVAVDQGISHVVAMPGEASIVATGTLPALRQRASAIVTLPPIETPIDGEAHLAWQVRAGVERCMAELGQRKLGGVLFASAEDAYAGAGAAWSTLQDYVAQGLVAEAGVVLTDPQHTGLLDGLEGLSLVLLDGRDERFRSWQTADHLAALAERVTMIGRVNCARCAQLVLRIPWVDAVVVEAASAMELEEALKEAAR